MEPRCFLCGKTVKELAEEELKERYNVKSVNITLSDEFSFPYQLCNTCEEFLRLAIPQILQDEGIISFDSQKDKYIVTK